MTLQNKYEDENPYRQRIDTNNSKQVFDTRGSAGNSPEKLAKILTAYDVLMKIMGWDKHIETIDGKQVEVVAKPIADLSNIVAQYQGSVDAKYHNDFKDIQIALEIERRRSERKGISILQS